MLISPCQWEYIKIIKKPGSNPVLQTWTSFPILHWSSFINEYLAINWCVRGAINCSIQDCVLSEQDSGLSGKCKALSMIPRTGYCV